MQVAYAGSKGSDQSYACGQRIVYVVTKRSQHPGPRAKHIDPTSKGDGYSYTVKKFWRVADVLADGSLIIATRRGKRRTISANDPCVRHAKWWEKLLLGARFPQPSVTST